MAGTDARVVPSLEGRHCVTIAEAARVLAISERAARRAVRDGRLPVIDLGPRRRRVATEVLRRMVRDAGPPSLPAN